MNEDDALEGSGGVLDHEGLDEFELVGQFVEVAALQLKTDDPVGHDAVEGCFLPYLERVVLVVPEAVGEDLEKR